MTTTITIDEVHGFMLDEIRADDAPDGDVIETLIYNAYQVHKQKQREVVQQQSAGTGGVEVADGTVDATMSETVDPDPDPDHD